MRLGLPSRPRVLRPAGVMLPGSPCGLGEDGDGGLADGFEAGEAVGDLGAELGFGGFAGIGEDEVDLDVVLLRDAGDACCRGRRGRA